MPFHYGDWRADGRARAANELTDTVWDPVSKQPMFKVTAARIARLAPSSGPAPAPITGAARPLDDTIPATIGGPTAQATSEPAGKE